MDKQEGRKAIMMTVSVSRKSLLTCSVIFDTINACSQAEKGALKEFEEGE